MLSLTFATLLHSIWFLTIIALIVGSLLILWASSIRKSDPHSLRGEILRDVGIAFIVAIIVTGIYELHMRTILETEKMEDVLSTVMKYNVPKSVWDEVNKNVLKSDAIRRNVKIDFEIKPDQSLQPGLALLFITYNYDIYRLKSNSAEIEVQHNIVNDYNNLARFERVIVTDAQGNTLAEYKAENGQERKKEFRTLVHMEQGYDFKKDVFIDERAVHVMNQRYEIINLPGTYSLGIPTIMEGTPKKPVEISVTIPESLNIKPSIDTQWREHTFKPKGKQGNKYTWTYSGIILPGQFLDVLVSEPVTSALATSP
jgi:hypothetical protein